MAKKDNSIKFKGILDVYDDYPFLRITEFEKVKNEVVEKVYDLHEILKEFNGKEVHLSVSDSTPLQPIEE